MSRKVRAETWQYFMVTGPGPGEYHAFCSVKVSTPKDATWQQFSRNIKSPCVGFFSTTHVCCLAHFNIQQAGTRTQECFYYDCRSNITHLPLAWF